MTDKYEYAGDAVCDPRTLEQLLRFFLVENAQLDETVEDLGVLHHHVGFHANHGMTLWRLWHRTRGCRRGTSRTVGSPCRCGMIR